MDARQRVPKHLLADRPLFSGPSQVVSRSDYTAQYAAVWLLTDWGTRGHVLLSNYLCRRSPATRRSSSRSHENQGRTSAR